MNKKILNKLMIVILFLIVTISGCVNEVSESCRADAECSGLKEKCFEEGRRGVISLSPFCIEGTCQCRCGHRDSEGDFVEDLCD